MNKAHTKFKAETWNEVPITEGETIRLTRASCRQTYTGELSGSSVLEYLMVYRSDGSAVFTGLEQLEGTLADRKGSFVLRHTGVFSEGTARMTLEVVQGTGTEELKGLVGNAKFESPHAPEYSLDFEYSFEDQP